MLGPPQEFHAFAPAWRPHFWELSLHAPGELLNAEQAFLQVLTVVRMESAERAEFAQAFQETLRRLEPMHGSNRVRWTEMIQLIFGWVLNRRPREERPLWSDLAAATQQDELRQEEMKAMAGLLGKTVVDEAYEDHARQTVLRLGRKRFGEPAPEIELELRKIEDLPRLDRMTLRVLDASSWSELLETQ
jgi:hypothetical protein